MMIRLLCMALIFGSSAPAFALKGELEAPGIAFPAGYPAREQIMAALNAPKATFEGGQFINDRTVLRYTGSTDALNRMMRELVMAPETVVAVIFARFEEADWWVEHEGMRFRFKINLNQRQKLHPDQAKFEKYETGPVEATVRLLEARTEVLKAETQLEAAHQEVKGPPLHAGDPQHEEVFPSFDSGAVVQGANLTWRNYVEWWNKTHGTPLRGDIELAANLEKSFRWLSLRSRHCWNIVLDRTAMSALFWRPSRMPVSSVV